MDITPILNLTKIALEDIQEKFDIKENLYKKYVEEEILKNDCLLHLLHLRNDNFDWVKETPLGGAGTSLNGIVLYCLIRLKNMDYVIETGVSGGYYTTFMIEALHATRKWPILVSLEISSNMKEVGKLIPQNTINKTIPNSHNDDVDWNLVTGKSSLDYFSDLKLSKSTHHAGLYSHDSLHTMAHMLKELNEFKQSVSDEFYVFIDDEKSDNFWDRCLQTGAFKKQGYVYSYISGKESRLNGHLGGFIKYNKIKEK
jgi:hypothetical protein